MNRNSLTSGIVAALLMSLSACGPARENSRAGLHVDSQAVCAASMAEASMAYDGYIDSGEASVPFDALQLMAEFADPDALAAYLRKDKGPQDAGLGEALRQASYAGNTANMEALLGMGANPDAMRAGHTPLSFASTCDRGSAARLLLASGADPYVRLEGGNDALMYAIAGNADEVVDAILDTGFDACRTRNDRGMTAYDVLQAAAPTQQDPRVHDCP